MSPKSGYGQECSCVAYRYPTDTPTDTQPAHIEARGPAAPQSVHLDWQPRKYVHMNECKYVRLFVCVCRYMHVYIYIYVCIYIYIYTHIHIILYVYALYVYAVLRFYSAAASRCID